MSIRTFLIAVLPIAMFFSNTGHSYNYEWDAAENDEASLGYSEHSDEEGRDEGKWIYLGTFHVSSASRECRPLAKANGCTKIKYDALTTPGYRRCFGWKPETEFIDEEIFEDSIEALGFEEDRANLPWSYNVSQPATSSTLQHARASANAGFRTSLNRYRSLCAAHGGSFSSTGPQTSCKKVGSNRYQCTARGRAHCK